MVIYGGRNDKIFDSTGNVALNDICVFNCNQVSWEPLAMFGQMPCSRWSHTMIPQSSTQAYHEGFILFGGVNLKAYCRSNFFTFSFSHKKALGMSNMTTERTGDLLDFQKEEKELSEHPSLASNKTGKTFSQKPQPSATNTSR